MYVWSNYSDASLLSSNGKKNRKTLMTAELTDVTTFVRLLDIYPHRESMLVKNVPLCKDGQ